MSGTSHDGLDIAYCEFTLDGGKWEFSIEKATTIPYPALWKTRLMELPRKDEGSIRSADIELGEYIGALAAGFIREHRLDPAFIASHGHTIFHEPDKGITLQIGDGSKIAEATGVTTICDFRSSDVAMGGQGAPLVPLGDQLLFAQYDYCLNIGGIANISFELGGFRQAFDICPANIVLNALANEAGKAYDDKGKMAAAGILIPSLLEQLESLPFYKQKGPRSLGREWVESNIFPVIAGYSTEPLADRLRTFTEHAAKRIAAVPTPGPAKSMLITGGGAYNDYLIERTRANIGLGLVIPDPLLIEFKEALVFAFLGLRRLRGEFNVLGSVTGSGKNHCAGAVYY